MSRVALSPSGSSIVALDLVRGLAALTVLLGHARVGVWVEFSALPTEQQTLLSSAFFVVARLGHEAVMIFFVLSGFLVGGKIIERVKAGSFYLADYALDRSTRILLPLIPACILTFSINAFVFQQSPVPI